MAKLSFLEVVSAVLLTSFVLWQETAAISLSTQISTLPPSTTFSPKAIVCDGFNCPIGRECAVDENHRPVCVCLDECPYTEDMVCGTDGRSYGNECQLQKEACPTDKDIRVAYKGFCFEGSVCFGHQCPSGKPCTVDQNNQPVCVCIQSCPYDYYPVCGSDGVTYSNLCRLKREACITGKNLTMARSGPCIYNKYCDGVVCPSPKFCVVDLKNQTSCGCRDDNYCGDYYYPVCGSDNKTYNSECHMATAACKINTNITLRYSGVCSEGPNCQGIYCPIGKHCDSQHQPEPKCVCDTVCPKFYTPLCGTNNKTYNNYCEVKRDACLTNTLITWRFNGRCDEGPGCSLTYNCPNGRKCVVDERNQPICACPQYCSSNSKEVCGTDNKTYTNECLLNVAACLTNRTIKVQRNGKCSEVATVCDGFSCPQGMQCAIDESNKPLCVCIDKCPYNTSIVCGSDGRTYGNDCELQKEACTSNTNTRVAYKGYCLEGSVCSGHRCPSDKQCSVNQYNQPVCVCIQLCPDNAPVCGSDERTYNSLCDLKRQACTTGKNITVARTGKCVYNEYCNGVVCPSPKSCVVDEKNQTSCVCRDDCDDYYYPVCGSDNKTYNSYCEMNAYACQTNTSITTLFYGACSEGSNCQGIFCPYGTHCDSVNQPEPKCVCNTVCAKTYTPLCGSNNKTYNNTCELQRDACLTNTAITQQFNRRCEEEPECSYTYCPYDRTCVVDERNQRMCVCSLYCFAGYTEVCGTDNKTYSSDCFLRAAACMTNKTFAVQRYERCKEEASGTTATTPIAGHP